MIEKITKQIEDFKNIVEVLPTNNKENRKKKREYINNEKNKSNSLLNDVVKEIFSRTKVLDDLVENPSIGIFEAELKKCNIMNEWSTYNTAYEKMHIDYYLYQLHRYYKNDFKSINNCIKKVLEAFKRVNINLTEKDFNYHNYVTKYLSLIMSGSSEEELKAFFEDSYWQFPELIKAIELNFKSIYLKNEKGINKYYDGRHQEYLKKHQDEELVNKKIKLIQEINKIREKDPFTIFQLFKNREYLVGDFKENDMESKKSSYFKDNSYSFIVLKMLYQILYEYSLILKYDYLFKDIKDLVNKKDTLKNVRANSLKDITKDEKVLLKLVSSQNSKFIFKKKKNDETWLFKYKEALNGLIKKYEEFEDACFDEIINTSFSKDSTALNALELISSNYLYYVKKAKKHLETDNIAEINAGYYELKELLNNNRFILLNHIALLDEYQMKQVIVDKYTLDGVTLTIEQLEPDNLEKTMNDIRALIRYENFKRSGLKLDDIQFYLNAEKDTEKYVKKEEVVVEEEPEEEKEETLDDVLDALEPTDVDFDEEITASLSGEKEEENNNKSA